MITPVNAMLLTMLIWGIAPVFIRSLSVDLGPADALVIEVTGDSGKTTAFLRVLEPYGIKEIAQSGLLAIGRGGKSITERVFKN